MVYFSSLYLELMGSYSTKQKNRSPEKLIKCTCAFFALHGRIAKNQIWNTNVMYWGGVNFVETVHIFISYNVAVISYAITGLMALTYRNIRLGCC